MAKRKKSIEKARSPEFLRDELVRNAKKKGVITYDDILNLLPDAEREITLLDNLMDLLVEAGLEITPENEVESGSAQSAVDLHPHIYIANITPEILNLLNLNPKAMYDLTPDAFELLICNRLEAMGYEVTRVTDNVNARDGGLDIIAWLPRLAFGGLIAIQVKHHKIETRKTGAKTIRELQGIVNENTFLQSGLVVTNTSFTRDATWAAERSRKIMSLKDWGDLIRWVHDDFSGEYVFTKLPDNLELGNGIAIPRSRFTSKPARES